jgi:hypothetical protein
MMLVVFVLYNDIARRIAPGMLMVPADPAALTVPRV